MTKLFWILAMGVFLGGCAVQGDDGEPGDESVQETESATKNDGKRAKKIADCKADCAAQYTPCSGLSGNPYSAKSTTPKRKCNPNIPPELSGNPYGLAICNDGCDKL